MEILALKGKGGSGKSTTIRILHYLLIQHRYALESSTISQKGDFRSIFIKKNKCIGLTSSGDTYDLVHYNLRTLIEEGSVICVCACRTFDRFGKGTNAAIDKFDTYQKFYFDKTLSSSYNQQVAANQYDAQILFDNIEARL